MANKKTGIFITSFIVLTWSCDTHDNPFAILTTDDEEIVEKAYSKTYMYPPGFKFQQNLDGSVYYENTVSIRASQTAWIELSTHNRQQAKSWSEISSSTSAYYRNLTEERETEKYFEFKRVYSGNTKDVILSRVHKDSYFVPDFDKLNPTNVIGTLKVNPINKETFKDFVEYIWTSYTIGYTGKVLEYTVTDYPDKVRCNLKSIHVSNGDFGLCDIIEVKNFDFFADKQSGIVTFQSNTIKEIRGVCR